MKSHLKQAQPIGMALCAFLFLALSSGVAGAATTNANFTTPTTTLSNNAAGAASTYTLSCKLKKKPSGAAIDHLATVTVTFPGGTNAQTITSATFQVSGPGGGNGTTTITGMTFPTANTVQFPCPAASVVTNKTIKIVLNGVTNALISGNYTASISAVNTTGGTDSGTNIFAYTLIAGTPTKLVIVQQPTAPIYAGRTINPPVTVAIKDANGNTVTSGTNSTLAVTIAIGTNPGGTLSGTKTVNAVAGIATFSTLSIDTIQTGYTLHATQTSLGLTAADTNSFDVIAAPPDFLVFSTQPSNVNAGTAFTVAVTVKDGVTGLTNITTPYTIALSVFSSSSGPIQLFPVAATTITATTSSGVATFSNINIHQAGPNGTTATYNLVAADGAVVPNASSALSNAFVVSPGTSVNAVAFLTQPGTSQAGSNATTPSPVLSTTSGVPVEVELQDGFGNRVTGASSTITMTLNTGAGTLSGATTANGGAAGNNGTAAIPGVAIFDDLDINLVGAHTLKAALSVSVFDISASFQITPAAASALTVTGLTNPSYIGFAADFTVTAKDEFGNVDTNYLALIDITCSDAGATFPTNYQFVSGDQGVHAFSGGVTFATVAASQSVTAADNTDADPANHFSGSQSVQVIKGDTSTTVLTISPSPAGKNEIITLTAQVTGGSFTPTGTVTFKDNGVALTGSAPSPTNPANLNGIAEATMTVAFAVTGTHSVTATFSGDTKYNPSTSTPANTLVIVTGTTTTSIARTAGVTPSVYGDSVTFTATVNPSTGSPALTGTVDFKDGSTVLASVAVDGSNQAAFTTTALNVATHSITAVYNGDGNFGQGFGGSVSQVVTALPITVTGTKEYDGSTTASAAGLSVTNNLDGANLSLSGSVTLASATLGSQSITSFGGLSLSGSAAGNYTLVGASGSVTIVDTTPPLISLLGTTPVTHEAKTAYVDDGATASDIFDGDRTSAVVTVNNVDVNTIGSYTVTYDVSDTHNNAAIQVVRTVNVVDTTKPVITLLGTTPVTVEATTPYTDAGATASDTLDGDLTASIVTVNNVNVNVPGTYTVTYDVTDAHNNAAIQVVRTVNVVDTTKPVITLLGTTPITQEAATPYTDAGATASDSVDGNLTASIVTVNNVNVNVVGTYTVTYDVTDAHNNAAVQVIRTVNVVDTTKPVITLLGATPITHEAATPYTDAGATASDSVDGNLTASIVTVNNVNVNVLGSYTVTYDVTDAHNNAAVQVVRTVNVVDTTKPVITLLGSTPVTHEAATPYTDAGATASDTLDGNLTASIVTVNNVNVNVVGSYSVTYNVSDTHSNAATQVVRTVNVVDTTAPVISVPANITADATSSNGATVNFSLNATDAIGPVSISSIPASGSTFAIGTTTVNITATDGNGNASTGSFKVIVVDNAPPVVVSTIAPNVTSGVVDQTVTFTFVVNDSSAITYTWDFGDGTIVSTTATSIDHVFTVPNAYPVKVTATDSGGHSTSDQTTFTVNAAATAPGDDICAGLNPIALRVQQVSAKLKFPATLKKDFLALKALVDLKDGFNPAGQVVQWEIGGIIATATLDAKGNSPISTTVKVSLKYTKPKSGQPFTARTGKLSIAMKGQSLTALKLAGITDLNANTTGTKGQAASSDICVVLTGHQAYHADAVTGIYKAKKDKGGSYSAKFKIK